MKRSFDSEKALSYVEIWEKNLFVAEGYLIDDERREGGTRNGSKWDLETLWMERPSKERNIRVNVRSCLGSWLHKAPLSNILCQFGGAIHKVNYTQQHCLTFFHINIVLVNFT